MAEIGIPSSAASTRAERYARDRTTLTGSSAGTPGGVTVGGRAVTALAPFGDGLRRPGTRPTIAASGADDQGIRSGPFAADFSRVAAFRPQPQVQRRIVASRPGRRPSSWAAGTAGTAPP